ncbi:superfamily II RNA helicase [Synechococcus sp. PCC 7502]|uniref:DEAD/DEAH box helicase n=1 Tax=Synechococcus sp. PCC 7502 TaxID=1173263 RepID=UPI00029FFCBB|nr:DEAD/DEAH box helicase [Synechococcus sp. PCC 7502]AFY73089.1 superfamily II RNA helicase [Synechococcus sp. PCC 7502]
MNSLDLDKLFPFDLDQFQHEAIAALNARKSIVVCAPTGSGKTLIGEYAIYKALNDQRRVFYTTPLKALSNQKLRDFRDRFGNENVGLLTGDTSVNRDAPILVMTTEIFRNMLYGTPIGEVGTSLTGVEVVVLDECHYMNDRARGTVWEESIIYCPPDIQLVALSATVANSAQLTDWISKVHGVTELIYSDYRPVPLQFHFANPKGLFPLLDNSGKKINPRLRGNPRNLKKDANGKPPRYESPSLPFVISQLQQRDMLPAIHFIFSRKGCDQAIGQLDKMSLVNESEAYQLKTQIDAFLEANPEVGRSQYISSLYRGIASHHAGILPAWKGLVEELFQQGLIKVVFATETLAAGINMPARTTVISSLSKRTDRGHRLLTASEFLQMAGRAGRRGMDAVGYVVTVQSPYEGAKDAAYLATAQADPLVSQFTPSYGMVLNLLQTHSIDEVRELVERSFGQYLAGLAMEPQQESIQELADEVELLETQLASIDLDLLEGYEKLRDRLREERRLHKILFQQSEEQRLNELAAYIPYVLTGTLLMIKSESIKTPISALLVAKIPSSGKFPWLVCLSQRNNWHVILYKDVFLLGEQWSSSDLVYPELLVLKPGQHLKGDDSTSAIAASIPTLEFPNLPPEVLAQQEKVIEVEAQLNEHPVSTWGDRSIIAKKARKLEQLKEKLEYQRGVLSQKQQHHWQEFSSLVTILQSFGCLQGVEPTAAGQVAASLRGDNELWLALAFLSGELDNLDPHHLATACAALVTENSRPDSRVNFTISPLVEESLSGLRGLRRQLFQIQKRHNVAIPIWLEYDLVGLIEQWALGMSWTELCANTSLDEGDIVRIARRTLDLLSQIPHIPHLPETIRQNAYRAMQLIDRFPVNEVI